MKIQFTIWSPKENFKKLYRLYAKDENGNDVGYIQYNLTSGRFIEAINIKTSDNKLNKVVEIAEKSGFDLSAFTKQFTHNLRVLGGGKHEASFLEI